MCSGQHGGVEQYSCPEAAAARACRGPDETPVAAATRTPCGRHETRARGDAGPGLAALLPPNAAFRLLDGDGGAGALKGRPRLVRALLVDLLQDRLGRAVDQVLGLLQAQAGQAAHLLDDLNLLVARSLEDDVELVLLLGLLGLAARGPARGRGDCRHGGGRLTVERVLELLHEIGELEQSHLLERLEEVVGAHLRHDGVFLVPKFLARGQRVIRVWSDQPGSPGAASAASAASGALASGALA